MKTLTLLKMAINFNSDMSKLKIDSDDNEILLDLNGDGRAEVALQDSDGDGNIDRIAFDVTCDGRFDLYLEDTDGNHIPDRIFTRDENGEVKELAVGPQVEETILSLVKEVGDILEEGKDLNEELIKRLSALDGEIAKIAQAK